MAISNKDMLQLIYYFHNYHIYITRFNPMRNTSLSLVSFILAFGILPACAAPLTLSEAIEIVKTQNLEIKSAAYTAKSSRQDVKMAQGHHYGALDFTQSVIRSNDALNVFGFKLGSREADFGDFGLAQYTGDASVMPKDLNYPGYQNFYQSKLTYTLPLYTGGKLSGYEKIAQEREAISQIETTNVTVQKIYQTKKSYYDAALIHSSLIHMKTILANIETLEKTTQGMITEGYAKKVDLLEVQAKKVNAQRLIAQMEANQKLTLHYLSFLLNQSVTEIALPQDETVQSTLTEADVMATNLDMQKASKGLEIRESMIQVANASYLPQVGAFAEASSADDTFLGNFSDHKAYTVGAKLTWNLFSGGADAAGLEKARIEQLKTKTDVELSRKAVALQYDQMKTEITALDLQITTLEQEVELANEIYRNYMGRYREHLVSMSDLLIKHSEQIERILNLQTIKNQRNERIFALEKLSNGAHL